MEIEEPVDFGLLGRAPESPGPGVLTQPADTFHRLQPCPKSLRCRFATREVRACANPQTYALGRVLQPGLHAAVDRALRRGAQGAFALGRGLPLPRHDDARSDR